MITYRFRVGYVRVASQIGGLLGGNATAAVVIVLIVPVSGCDKDGHVFLAYVPKKNGVNTVNDKTSIVYMDIRKSG